MAPNIAKKDMFGNDFNLENYKGSKVLISFFRFSTCPFCNLRINQLSGQYDSLGIKMVAIFESSNENLNEHIADYNLPFTVLSDTEAKYYTSYGLEKSVLGMLKGMFTRPIQLIKGLMLGNMPFVVDGNATRMPAEFLLDEEGVIKALNYGKDEGDHMDIKIIQSFSKVT